MPSAKLTSKGQITIPKDVRKALGLNTGDRLDFRVQANGRVELTAAKIDLMSLKGIVRSKVRGVTVAQMNRDIRRAGGKD